MAIGVFDSGVGGLTIHRALTQRLPDADFIYLADQAHVPYGVRAGEEIVQLACAGCECLFHEGCNLVVLACNTASAVALRQIQQSWLPQVRDTLGRWVNVLGIIVPTIEVAIGRAWDAPHPAAEETSKLREVLGLFATPATARSRVYEIEIAKRSRDYSVVTEPCPELAALIEHGTGTRELSRTIEAHFAAMAARIGRAPDKVVLGSTHYEVVADLFRHVLPEGIEIIRQPRATADALEAYLSQHGELDAGRGRIRRFLTTGRAGMQHALIESYWGEPLRFEAA
jgi:glutamate racemase